MNPIFALLFLTISAVLGIPSALADRIELVDGSEINGEVVAISDGLYTVRSTTLGQIEVPESSIRIISPGGDSDSDTALNTELQSVQQSIVGSPDLMQMVMALQSDPELQAAINDPEFIKLVTSGDLDTLGADPRILRLLADPSIQAIVGKMSNQ